MSEVVPAPEVIEGRVVPAVSVKVRGWTAGPISVVARTPEAAAELVRQGIKASKREFSYEWPPQGPAEPLRQRRAIAGCADCGATTDLRPLRLLTSPGERWLCADADACVRRTLQRFYWTSRVGVAAR